MNVRKHYSKILSLAVALIVFMPSFAFAQNAISEGIYTLLWSVVNNVFGGLLGISGVMLDGALELFVSGFAETFIQMGQGVDLAWVMIRDIFNLTFIFGLVWIGMKMILGSDDSGARRNLIYLILAALLVNFSLFFTKFIIDFTNILASQILTSGFEMGEGIREGSQTAQVSTTFMQIFELNTIFDNSNFDAARTGSETGGGFMYIFGAAIVFLIGAFCFFAGAFMIALRFVALCIYMVFSPIMFLGWVFPQLQSFTSRYWSGFLGRAFFAPAYIILIHLAAYIMSVFPNTAGNMAGALNPAVTPTAQTAGIMINFMLVAMFLIASVVVGSKMGVDGAGVVMKAGNNISGRAKRMVQNTGTAAATATVRGVGGGLGRKASVDAENMRRRLDSGLGNLSQKGGFARATARTIDRTVGSSLRAGERLSVAGSDTLEQRRKKDEELQKKFNTTNLEDMRLRDAKSDDPAKVAKAVSKMSADELTKLSQEELKKDIIAQNISDAQIKGLADSGKYTNEEVKEVGDARTKAIYDNATKQIENFVGSAKALNTAFEELNRTVSRWSTETLEGMGATKLADPKIATNLNQRQLDALRDSGKITTGDYATITAARAQGFEEIAKGATETIPAGLNTNEQSDYVEGQQEKLFTQNAQDAGKLPAIVYTTKAMAKLITPAALTQRVRNGLTSEEITKIEENIKVNAMTPGSREEKMWQNWQASTTEGSRFNF